MTDDEYFEKMATSRRTWRLARLLCSLSLVCVLATTESTLPPTRESDRKTDNDPWFTDHTPERAKPTSLIRRAGQPDEFRNLYFSINRFSILQEAGTGGDGNGDGDGSDNGSDNEGDGNTDACRRSKTNANADSYPEALGVHVPIDCIPVVSAAAFLSNAKVTWISGVSLWIDFPPSADVSHLGHWMEIAAEIRAHVLGASEERRRAIKHVIVYPLFKDDIAGCPWVIPLLSAALEGVPTFKLWFTADLSTDLDQWVGIEGAVRFGGWSGDGDSLGAFTTAWTTTTASPAVKELRSALWRLYDVHRGANERDAARDVTLVVPVDEAGVSNAREVLEALQHTIQRLALGPGGITRLRVRPYSATIGAPLGSMVKRMAQTKVLIARHGPLLGMAALLPPGSIVVELLPHRYDGFSSFDLFHTMSGWLGDVSHLTLAANSTDVTYTSEDDKQRYEPWTGGECYGDDCLEAMQFSGMRVDVPSFVRMLGDIVAADNAGAGPLRSRYAHPRREARIQTNSGIWYDNVQR